MKNARMSRDFLTSVVFRGAHSDKNPRKPDVVICELASILSLRVMRILIRAKFLSAASSENLTIPPDVIGGQAGLELFQIQGLAESIRMSLKCFSLSRATPDQAASTANNTLQFLGPLMGLQDDS